MTKTVMIMAGGTGGHVYPALAVARGLRSNGCSITWMGSKGGFEAGVVPDNGFPLDEVSIKGLRGKGFLSLLLAPFTLLKALLEVRSILRKRKPDLVIGFGGFVSGPGGLMARMLKIPLVIHEQNAIPGLTNRVLSKFAVVVLEAFPGSFDKAATHTGNPVREEITQVMSPAERFSSREGNMRVLVLGGSLGAQILNEVLPEALALIDEEIRPAVCHQSGRNKLEPTQANYAKAEVQAHISEFVDDMAGAYEWADLVICRAGALTISELAAVGVGSLLVPYPHAVDDHQTVNGQFLVNASAAHLCPQSKLDAESLAKKLMLLIKNPNRVKAMAFSAHQMAKPDATAHVVRVCERVMTR